MRFVPTRAHGVLDYTVGALLILVPYLFGFQDTGLAAWLLVVLGAGALVYRLLTDYEWGVVRVIPMQALLLHRGTGLR